MATDRISIRLTPALRRRLVQQATTQGKTASDLVREALDQYFVNGSRVESCYDLALRTGLLGAVKTGPRDLATNKKYFKGFGR
ncbi:MAG: hypothetical protein HY238_24350 [Acidobacteria bacterium]|nr:hypothetical protein [Acidobacteriota bacterium]